jgi:hypothetical protein
MPDLKKIKSDPSLKDKKEKKEKKKSQDVEVG